MSLQMTLNFTDNATSSPESVGGPMRCNSQESPTIIQSGPDPAHANLSARQAKERGLLTSGTFGPHSTGSPSSAALTSSLASRLHQRMDCNGGMEWRLIWKASHTPALRSIYRLRASVHRTSGTDCSGWPTTVSRDHKDGPYCQNVSINGLLGRVCWMTAPWATPKVQDLKHHPSNGVNTALQGRQIHLPHQAGMLLNGSPAPTAKSAQLNPAFSRWLMGFPPIWCVAAILSHRQRKAKKRGSSDLKATATP